MSKNRKICALALATISATGAAASETEAWGDTVRGHNLQEVTVTGTSAHQRVSEIRLGAEKLELSRLAQTPNLLGENDLIRSLSLMPGVHGEGEGAGGFEVRGGTSSQNLVMLDGISLYNPAHVMGIFSTFNSDAVSRATLFKGPIPACYGGATSSVLETMLEPGDMKKYHGSLTVGLLMAKIKTEGPIIKDKLSFAVTARRSYVDAFLQLVPEYRKTVMNFYDVTAKLRFIPRQGDYLDFSFMTGRDNMAIKKVMGMHWGNLGASLNWGAHAGDRWRFTTTGTFTHYYPTMDMTVLNTDQRMREYIRDYSISENAVYSISDSHTLDFGLKSQLLRVKSADTKVNGHHQRDIRAGLQNGIWVNYTGEYGPHFAMEAGVRLSLFTSLTGKRLNSFSSLDEPDPDIKSKTYVDAEPRVSLKYNINECHNLKAGLGITTQNLHAVRANTTSFPFDRYALTSEEVKPERCMQYGLGYTGATPSGAFDWSAELYYKDMRNVYDYRDGMGMYSAINLESLILGGKGRSYGLELMFRKNTGRLTGWVSYTLSRTQSRIPGINDGKWYDAGNDRRHDFTITANYEFNDRWSMSGAWVYSSGQPLTAPDVKYDLNGVTCYYYSKRNGYRTPATHRLDLSATYRHVGKKFTYEWSFGVYNAYCRYNPYVVYFEDDASKSSGTRAVMQSLYGIIPSVSYTLKF